MRNVKGGFAKIPYFQKSIFVRHHMWDLGHDRE